MAGSLGVNISASEYWLAGNDVRAKAEEFYTVRSPSHETTDAECNRLKTLVCVTVSCKYVEIRVGAVITCVYESCV